jgi:exosortase E/protease (VPEID-CTERM system)
LGRLYLLAGLLAADCAIVASIPHAAPLLGPIAPSGIVAFAVFLGLGRARLRQRREQISFRAGLFWAHLACIAAVFLANIAAGSDAGSWLNSQPALLLSGAVLAGGVVLLALACLPLPTMLLAVRETGSVWVYSVLAGISAWFLRAPFQLLWIHASAANIYLLQRFTFRCVQGLLGFLLPDLVVDAGPFVIGTPRFSVSVGAPCSGIEGLGLVLVFTLVWLWFFRKENRFPQALVLIPGALACAFLLNVVRIAGLILIGNAGAPDVAFVGFHSQAGWIAFTLVALGFSVATERLAWVRKPPAGTERAAPLETASGEPAATRAYLLPFLAIMAAAFVAKSASGYFEWLYPLRFVSAAGVLWVFRAEYRRLNWRFGWGAVATGTGIFLLWLTPEWLGHGGAASPLGPALAALSPAARITWIGIRIAAAVVTVPLAEELAFRGYLARRVMGRDFDEVPFTRLTVVAIALSSLLFGLMHGQHWLVGIAAGVAYAVLLRAKGRMGDAVAAHAVSNLLLAGWVLARGDWGLW